MLDFRIDTFIAVCKYMNFTKAAQALNITQPAVSQHIHFLENEYEVKLFTYIGKKMQLTEYGELLLAATTTMKHDEQLLREVLIEKQNRQEIIKLGATLTVGEYMIPHKIANYIHLHPETTVSINCANTNHLTNGLNSGEIDVAIVEGYFTKKKYDYLIYSSEPYIAVCSKNHTFKTMPHTLVDLLSEPIIVREVGSGTREILEKILDERSLSLDDFKSITEISNMNAIKILTQKDCGITFLYEAAVREELNRGTLIKLPLEDFTVTHDINFIWRKNSIFADNYRKFYEELKSLPSN